MGKRLPHTPSSTIRSALRRLWLRSRERATALRRTGYRCESCGRKQSAAKGRECTLEVHHTKGVTNWQAIEDAIRRELLVDPTELSPLCEECHKKEHNNGL